MANVRTIKLEEAIIMSNNSTKSDWNFIAYDCIFPTTAPIRFADNNIKINAPGYNVAAFISNIKLSFYFESLITLLGIYKRKIWYSFEDDV